MSSFKFGLIPYPADATTALHESIAAERSGFGSVWIPDSFVDLSSPAGLNPWIVLSALAARTTRVVLGTGVVDTQRDHPARIAQLAATLDAVSRGRVRLGIGAGEAMHIQPFGLPWEPPAQRLARLNEAVRIIRLLWNSSPKKTVTFSGSFYRLENAYLSQLPVQRPSPPIFIGTFSSKKSLDLVGRVGDGWYSWLDTPETFRKRWGIIKKAAHSASRNSKSIEPWSHLLVAFPRNTEEKRGAIMVAKANLILEKTVLASLGHASESPTHQNINVLSPDAEKVTDQAKLLPDEVAYKTIAIGAEEAHGKIEAFAKVGLYNFAVADLLGKSGRKRTLRIFKRIIRSYL